MNTIPIYNAFLQKLKDCEISQIPCNELFDRYNFMFDNNFEIFRNCLEYLEKQGKIHIIRPDFDEDLIHAIELL